MRKAWLALIPLAAVGVAIAQEERVLKVDVDLVNLLFTVREKKGGLVGDLTKDDFTVFEDGKQQTIKMFSRETDIPLTLGLLVDVSRSQERLIETEKNAANQFLSKVLRPKDMAFLISFGSDAELLQDMTNSPKLLKAGLDGLKLSSDFGGLTPGPVPTAHKPKGTILYDAVYLAAHDQLRNEVGRKAVVLITDGMDQGSHYTRDQAIEAAQRANVIIYSIYYVDHAAYGGGFGFVSDGELKRMSEETGGRVFHVDRNNSLQQIFDQLQQELRTQYVITYTPTNSVKDGAFRRVDVKTSRKDLKVQARKGYYASAN